MQPRSDTIRAMIRESERKMWEQRKPGQLLSVRDAPDEQPPVSEDARMYGTGVRRSEFSHLLLTVSRNASSTKHGSAMMLGAGCEGSESVYFV